MRWWFYLGWPWSAWEDSEGIAGQDRKRLNVTLDKPGDRLTVQPEDADTDTGVDSDSDTATDLDIEFVVMDEEELERPYRVIIHNDNVTTFDFVIAVLVSIFELSFGRAEHVAYEAHTRGQAYVATLPLHEAKSRVFKAQYAARQQGFPLPFTIEPE